MPHDHSLHPFPDILRRKRQVDEQAAATGIGSEGAPLGPHELREQAPVRALGVKRNMATAPENACAGLGYVIGNACERTRMTAVDLSLIHI